MMDQLRFTFPEILSLVGLIQCVYILVYMLFRAGDWRRAFLPLLYFFVLGLAFFLDFASSHLHTAVNFLNLAQWAAWFSGPPLSVLLITQVAKISERPTAGQFWILLLIPAAGLTGVALAQTDINCSTLADCPMLDEWLVVTGLLAGLASLLALWSKRGLLHSMVAEKAARERYWLILTLIFVNLFFLGVMLLSLTPVMNSAQAEIIRSFLGLGLVYLAGSSLFRIYPQAVQMVERRDREALNDREKEIAARIEGLLSLEKIYQEATYDRAHLARELNIPEATASRIINLHFNKSFPQVLNERRINDALVLLADSNLAIKDIAEQVGFSSMASFSRVFREQTGTTPGAYRKDLSAA